MPRIAGAAMAVILGVGCAGGHGGPNVPSPLALASSPLKIAEVSPQSNWPFYFTRVYGAGFQPGMRVKFDGLDAQVNITNGGYFTVGPPFREPGTVDVMLTNPDGTSVTLVRGFTYKAATLELSPSIASPGQSVVMTWSGPNDPSDFQPPDLIGLFKVDEPFHNQIWDRASGVGDRFSVTFEAPAQTGSYEVRYRMLSQYLLAKAPLTIR